MILKKKFSMDDSETEPILPKLDTRHPQININEKRQCSGSGTRRWIPVEFITILYVITYVISVPVSTFYIYSKVVEKYNVKNFAKKGHSSCENVSEHKSFVLDKIQKDAADQFMYLSLLGVLPALVSILYLGSISDKYGRKVSLLIAFVGLLTREIIYIIVIYTDAPIFALYIGHFLQGLTGYTSSPLLAVYGIIADITEPGKHRSLRLAVVEAIVSITAGITSFATGFWIKYTGFLIPMVASSLICLVNIAITVIFIPETKVNQEAEINVKNALFRCFSFYLKADDRKRRGNLILCQIVIILTTMSVLGKISVETLFQLNRPLCWSELHVQIFRSVENVINWVVSVITVKILLKYIQDLSIIFIGCLAGTAALIVYAFAGQNWIIYIYLIIGTLAVTVIPMTRSVMSRLVSVEEQGAVFASIAFVELSCHLLTSAVYTQIYKLTESYFSGLVFLVMAALMFLALIASTILSITIKENKRTDE